MSEEMGDYIEYEFELKNNATFRKQGLRLIREGLLTLNENVFPYSTEGDLLPELDNWINKFRQALEANLLEEIRINLKEENFENDD